VRLGVLQKNSGSTNFENSEDSRQHDYYYYQFYLAASSHEIFLRVGGREGMKGLGALQRHQLPHPLAKILDQPLPSTGAEQAMKPQATAIGDPQDGRWKITSMFDGRRFCIP